MRADEGIWAGDVLDLLNDTLGDYVRPDLVAAQVVYAENRVLLEATLRDAAGNERVERTLIDDVGDCENDQWFRLWNTAQANVERFASLDRFDILHVCPEVLSEEGLAVIYDAYYEAYPPTELDSVPD